MAASAVICSRRPETVKLGHDVGDPGESTTPKDDGLKDRAEQVAASQEPLLTNELFRDQPPKFFGSTEARFKTRPPLPVVPSKHSVWPLVILLFLIVALIAAIFLAALAFGATPR